jgi:hypothetical protein
MPEDEKPADPPEPGPDDVIESAPDQPPPLEVPPDDGTID